MEVSRCFVQIVNINGCIYVFVGTSVPFYCTNKIVFKHFFVLLYHITTFGSFLLTNCCIYSYGDKLLT